MNNLLLLVVMVLVVVVALLLKLTQNKFLKLIEIFFRFQFLVALTLACASAGVNLIKTILIGHLTLGPHHPRALDHRQISMEKVSYLCLYLRLLLGIINSFI